MSYQVPTLIGQNDDPGLVQIDPKAGIERNFRLALIVIAGFLLGMVALAALTGTHGAVIGAGEVTVESRVKKIAHPQGGIISAVEVSEGDRVRKGQVLMRLDDTVSGASATAAGDTAEQLMANAAMLEAERNGAAGISFPPGLTVNPTPAKLAAMAQARNLLALRRQTRAQQLSQINERIRQSEEQIRAYEAQKRASEQQSALVQPELEGLRSLRERELVTINRLNQIERTAVDLQGTAASFAAQIAQARARIAELRQSAAQLVQDVRSNAGAELLDIQSRLNEQTVRSVAAQDTFDRSLVRAPYDGIIEKLAYTTVGGVVPPMETILEIVPTEDRLTIMAKISPYDIDQLSIDQPARLMFSAFNNRTTPELNGKVARISADRFTDERSGASFYKVAIEVDDKERARLGDLKLVPGMPVEVFIQTGERSLLSYITKPLRDQFNRAFREN